MMSNLDITTQIAYISPNDSTDVWPILGVPAAQGFSLFG